MCKKLGFHFGKKDILVHSESFLRRPPPRLGEARKDSVLDRARNESVRPRNISFFVSAWRLIPKHCWYFWTHKVLRCVKSQTGTVLWSFYVQQQNSLPPSNKLKGMVQGSAMFQNQWSFKKPCNKETILAPRSAEKRGPRSSGILWREGRRLRCSWLIQIKQHLEWM